MRQSLFDDVVEAFNSEDHDRRVELLRRCLAEDAEVVHVHGESVGPVGFSTASGEIRRGFPGLHARLNAGTQTLHRWDRQAWALVDAEGNLFATGSYVARRSDNDDFSHLVSLPDPAG